MCRSLSSDAENGNGADSGEGSKSIAVAITDLRKTYAAADGSAKQVSHHCLRHGVLSYIPESVCDTASAVSCGGYGIIAPMLMNCRVRRWMGWTSKSTVAILLGCWDTMVLARRQPSAS